MSNLYTLTARIHELLPLINQKYGLEIEVKQEKKFIIEDGRIFDPKEIIDRIRGKILTRDGVYPAIQTPQIRQILLALKDVLGDRARWFFKNILGGQDLERPFPNTVSEALCQRWLEGLNPLFDREPEFVLSELREVLENLLK